MTGLVPTSAEATKSQALSPLLCWGGGGGDFSRPWTLARLESVSVSKLLSKFGEMSFQEYFSEGFFHPIFYGYLAYRPKATAKEYIV